MSVFAQFPKHRSIRGGSMTVSPSSLVNQSNTLMPHGRSSASALLLELIAMLGYAVVLDR